MTEQQQQRTAIIVMGGSFSPIHSGHLACMRVARDHLIQERGFANVLAFFAVATEGYVRQKYKAKGSTHIALHHRLALVNALAEEEAFLQTSQKAFGAAIGMITKLLQVQFPDKPASEFFIVVGADRAKPRRGPFETIAIARAIEQVSVSTSASASSTSSAHANSTLLTAPVETLALSATVIRERLCIGCSAAVGHSAECVEQRATSLQSLRESNFLPPTVCDYFAANPESLPFHKM
jgi:nicotinic acid mononucleotide adenylyltransferase